MSSLLSIVDRYNDSTCFLNYGTNEQMFWSMHDDVLSGWSPSVAIYICIYIYMCSHLPQDTGQLPSVDNRTQPA